MSEPTILLLQTRSADDPVIAEEIRIFARNAGVPTENVIPNNLLETTPTLAQARRHDAVMIGDVQMLATCLFLATLWFSVVVAGWWWISRP